MRSKSPAAMADRARPSPLSAGPLIHDTVSERPDPCVMVIFGAGGDLTRRQLVPSLCELESKGFLPKRFAVVGFSRGERDDARFRTELREALDADADLEAWSRLVDRVHYVSGSFGSADAFNALAGRIEEIRAEAGVPDNVFFHLAAPPDAFAMIVEQLEASGLARSKAGWRRLVVEKPFGRDRPSSIELNRRIGEVFDEHQTYRIDHFLAKETVQNMLVFRFTNPTFEPIWNRRYVDHVQITVAEKLGIESRGAFYEETGVVRDMIQNHLLQLLCMTAIEPPVRFDADAIRDETVKVLRAAQITPFDVESDAVRGQYASGIVDDELVGGYRSEDHVDPESGQATFAALRLTLDNWRWAGVPFYLRTGKRLPCKWTEVLVHFRPTPHLMLPHLDRSSLASHVLQFRLQPDEGIVQEFLAKQPGPELTVRPVTMDFRYADTWGIEEPPRAYAWLIYDVIRGDQHLFARADWIAEAWSVLDPLIEYWETSDPGEIPTYPAGSWGPDGAHALLAREGRSWRRS